MALRSVLSGVTSCQSNAQADPMGRPGHLRYETELWQSHHRLVYLGVLAGPHRAAPTEDDTLGAGSGQPEGVARPVLDVAELRGDVENRRQPSSGDGEWPQIRGITLGRVVGLPGDHGPACARADHFHDVDGVVLIWRDPGWGGPGSAAIGGVGEPPDVTVSRGGLGVP